MSSQRQRKRNAQFKKKKFDHRQDGKPEGHIKREKDQPLEPKQKINENHPSLEEQEPPDKIEEKSYKKQTTLSSNWERYDEHENNTIDEEIIERRLHQLLTTKLPPNQPIQPSTSSPTTEETSLPSLDLTLLGSVISHIPLYKRLNIDKDLIDISQRRYTDQTVVQNDVVEPSVIFSSSSLKSQSNSKITPLTNTKTGDDTNKNSDDELNEILHKGTATMTKQKDNELTKISITTTKLSSHETYDELDSELDKLLDM